MKQLSKYNYYFFGIAIAFAFLYLFIMQIYAAWDFNVDDMYITLRYARHLLDGHGIVWNIGDSPIEGYSNFSFLLIAALSMKLALNPVITLKLISILFLLISVIMVYAITRLWVRPKYAVIPALWLLFYPGEILWAVSGLETAVFQGLILSSLFCLFRGLGYEYDKERQPYLQNKYFFLSGLLLSLAGLTRPDTPAFMLVWLFALWWTLYVSDGCVIRKNRMQAIVYFCVTIGFIYGPYFIWRWHYFGALFPNSVYCKWMTGVDIGVLSWQYLKLVWPLLLLAMPYLLRVKDIRKLFMLLPSIIYLILLYDSDSVVGVYNRHFLSCFALLLPLAFMGYYYLVTKLSKYTTPITQALITYLFPVFFALFFLEPMTLMDYEYFKSGMVKGNRLRQQLVTWISQQKGPKSTVMMADCGATGYFSELYIIDSYCLNSKEMTSKAIHNSTEKFANRVLTIDKPETIVLTILKENGHLQMAPVDKDIANNANFKENYQCARVFQTSVLNEVYQYEVYFKKSTNNRVNLPSCPKN